MKSYKRWLVFLDQESITVDNLRVSGVLTSFGSSAAEVVINKNDLLVFYDCKINAVVTHGRAESRSRCNVDVDSGYWIFKLSVKVSRKDNFPYKCELSDIFSSYFKITPENVSQCYALEIDSKDYNSVFENWWGVFNFESELVVYR